MTPDSIIKLLHCPECKSTSNKLNIEAEGLRCPVCNALYPLIKGRPVMLRNTNSLFKIEDYLGKASPKKDSWKTITNFVPRLSVNLAFDRMLNRLKQEIMQSKRGSKYMRILVVGAGLQRKSLDETLRVVPNVILVYTDIDVNADVDVFCDGHDLPFDNEVFDAVITTAVLEHVLYPERVAKEIYRVLKLGGVLYSEFPFMQQVHEGAYDFTRYTLSGHRRLFNGFTEIECGMVAGPGTALAWAIENYVLAFFRKRIFRQMSKVMVRFIFSWLKYTDKFLINRPEAMDGASCTYFFGCKSSVFVADEEIIERYIGSKHLSHT